MLGCELRFRAAQRTQNVFTARTGLAPLGVGSDRMLTKRAVFFSLGAFQAAGRCSATLRKGLNLGVPLANRRKVKCH